MRIPKEGVGILAGPSPLLDFEKHSQAPESTHTETECIQHHSVAVSEKTEVTPLSSLPDCLRVHKEEIYFFATFHFHMYDNLQYFSTNTSLVCVFS